MKRLYIHEKVYDAVRDALVEYARKAKIGDPSDPSTEFGPIQNRIHYEKVKYVLVDPQSITDIFRSSHCNSRHQDFL
jgi:acyl-CoA reductase-like NAD-dependent aldehyde dehydrogenase